MTETHQEKVQRELEERLTAAKAVMPLPETVDGMELGNRLLDYDPGTWSQNGRFQVGSVQRGEIVSLVDPKEAADDIDKAHPHRLVVLNITGTGSNRHLDLFDPVAQTVANNVELPAIWPVQIRLDLVYLDSPRDLWSRVPEPVQPVTPVDPANVLRTGFSVSGRIAEHLADGRVVLESADGSRTTLTPQPMGAVMEEMGRKFLKAAGLEGQEAPVEPVHRADGTAVKYRGVPVPAHLLAGWPDSGAAMSWRAGVNDTLRELGMAEVVPLHLRAAQPVAPEPRLSVFCGLQTAHQPHPWEDRDGRGNGIPYNCPGSSWNA